MRSNLSYLAPGGRGRIWLLANAAYGLILNLIPLVLGAYMLGNVCGLLLGAMYPGLGTHEPPNAAAALWVAVVCGTGAGVALFVVGRRRFLDKESLRRKLEDESSELQVTVAIGAAFVVFTIGLLLPALLYLIGGVTEGQVTRSVGLGETSLAISRLIVGVGVVGGSLILGGSAVWLLRRRRHGVARGVLAYISGFGILFAPFLLGAQTSVVRGWKWQTDGAFWLVGATVLLAFGIFIHNRRYSMHLFYRERIQRAFALRRIKREGQVGVEDIPYRKPIWLSEVADRNADLSKGGAGPFPELVMCTAVAARGAEVPSRTWAASFTFKGITSGNRRIPLEADTKDLETGDWIGDGGLTLPAIMAISGAAISPLMGRYTLPAFRLLMAVMNLRLGVWIKNPRRRDRSDEPTGEAGVMRRMWRSVARGWREPGAWYVLKEGLGLADLRGKYLYVSDGGHWENLGLTELLRERCTHVVVVDASGTPGLGSISRAMSVARAELGVEFDLDPRRTAAESAELADSPVVVGRVRYPDGGFADIFYTRSVLWAGAPVDLQLFAAQDGRFPNHPTSNQFLSGELFDAYRALGCAVGDYLIEELKLPPEKFDELREEPTLAYP